MLPDVESHVAAWNPDIIVRETGEFARLAAERMGLPHASIATGSWSSLDDRREVVADVLDGWRGRLGMEPDPSALMMAIGTTIWPSRRRAGTATRSPPTAHFIRYVNPRARLELRRPPAR